MSLLEMKISIIKNFSKYKDKSSSKTDGKCKVCGEKFDISEMQADHIKAWSKGGKQ